MNKEQLDTLFEPFAKIGRQQAASEAEFASSWDRLADEADAKGYPEIAARRRAEAAKCRADSVESSRWADRIAGGR